MGDAKTQEAELKALIHCDNWIYQEGPERWEICNNRKGKADTVDDVKRNLNNQCEKCDGSGKVAKTGLGGYFFPGEKPSETAEALANLILSIYRIKNPAGRLDL